MDKDIRNQSAPTHTAQEQWEKSQQAANKLRNCTANFILHQDPGSNLPTSGKHNNGFYISACSPVPLSSCPSGYISRSIYPH
ncbi:GL20438 [Drosophila persimilis]|uniref:GL20438 n=1 Tax=Drosophila persimilis TaxID=7234 RepID=B4H513_DROPE|nr:GL20592 [Drosophila persimilis]EDW39391.1 GL20438 [Drosophila persimilis]